MLRCRRQSVLISMTLFYAETGKKTGGWCLMGTFWDSKRRRKHSKRGLDSCYLKWCPHIGSTDTILVHCHLKGHPLRCDCHPQAFCSSLEATCPAFPWRPRAHPYLSKCRALTSDWQTPGFHAASSLTCPVTWGKF